jgi:hypothetical protein
MAYAIAYQVATEVANYFMERERAKADAAQADRIIRAVVNAFNAAKEEILNEMREQRVRDLMGDYVGLYESLNNYLQITKTLNFLEEILSRADSLMGDLTQETSSNNAQMVLECYPIMMATTSLRCLLRSEFKYAWGADPGKANKMIVDEVKAVNRLSGTVLHLLKRRVIIELWGTNTVRVVHPDFGEALRFEYGWKYSSEAHGAVSCLNEWLAENTVTSVPDRCFFGGVDTERELVLRTTAENCTFDVIKRTGLVPAALALGEGARLDTYNVDRAFWDEYVADWDRIQRTVYGTATHLPGAGWVGKVALTALGDHLYAIENGKLWRVNPEDGRPTHLSGSGWVGEIVLTALGDHLYAIENEKLYRVNPQDGTATHLPGSGWIGKVALTALDDHLYAIENGKLWRVNPEDGRPTHLPGSRWGSEIVLTALGDYLYAIENEKLWRVRP